MHKNNRLPDRFLPNEARNVVQQDIRGKFRLFSKDIASKKRRSAIENYICGSVAMGGFVVSLGGAGVAVAARKSLFPLLAQGPNDASWIAAGFLAFTLTVGAVIFAALATESFAQARQSNHLAHAYRNHIPVSSARKRINRTAVLPKTKGQVRKLLAVLGSA